MLSEVGGISNEDGARLPGASMGAGVGAGVGATVFGRFSGSSTNPCNVCGDRPKEGDGVGVASSRKSIRFFLCEVKHFLHAHQKRAIFSFGKMLFCEAM